MAAGRIVLVLSGEGGVGKSTVSAQMAQGIAADGHEVGLLDLDICGPSVPTMFALQGEEVHQSNAGWSPVYVEVRPAPAGPLTGAPTGSGGPPASARFVTNLKVSKRTFLHKCPPPSTTADC